jgi:hypothetical protein
MLAEELVSSFEELVPPCEEEPVIEDATLEEDPSEEAAFLPLVQEVMNKAAIDRMSEVVRMLFFMFQSSKRLVLIAATSALLSPKPCSI